MTKEKRKPTISFRLPSGLLQQVDELVERTGMRSRTEFVERALVDHAEALKEAKVLRVRPYTPEEARAAILRDLEAHPARTCRISPRPSPWISSSPFGW